ncbi:MAG: succinate dehydrogenase, hydrophobic rane anchor protein [Pseudomonadota bacterium]|jgi:succinate dehydrogenase / fumarate reductase membrane anchor subunit
MEHTPPLTISSSKGTFHWVMQRITALGLVPLSFWLIIFLNKCLTAPYINTLSWLKTPLNLICIFTWLVLVFYHAALGLQVVIEDYIATASIRFVAIWGANLSFIFLVLIAFCQLLNIISIG